jgi:hypothetical protein
MKLGVIVDSKKLLIGRIGYHLEEEGRFVELGGGTEPELYRG